jgi:hypothetical protein
VRFLRVEACLFTLQVALHWPIALIGVSAVGYLLILPPACASYEISEDDETTTEAGDNEVGEVKADALVGESCA